MAHRVVRPRIDVAREPGAQILSREQRAVAARIYDVRFIRARRDVAGLPATGFHPIANVDAAGLPTRPAERAVVLLRAADMVREVVRRDDVVELRSGEVLVGPRA